MGSTASLLQMQFTGQMGGGATGSMGAGGGDGGGWHPGHTTGSLGNAVAAGIFKINLQTADGIAHLDSKGVNLQASMISYNSSKKPRALEKAVNEASAYMAKAGQGISFTPSEAGMPSRASSTPVIDMGSSSSKAVA
jgi:hypothetical protein